MWLDNRRCGYISHLARNVRSRTARFGLHNLRMSRFRVLRSSRGAVTYVTHTKMFLAGRNHPRETNMADNQSMGRRWEGYRPSKGDLVLVLRGVRCRNHHHRLQLGRLGNRRNRVDHGSRRSQRGTCATGGCELRFPLPKRPRCTSANGRTEKERILRKGRFDQEKWLGDNAG